VVGHTDSDIIIHKEMGYSRCEFIHQFKIFAASISYTLSEDQINIPTLSIEAQVQDKLQNPARIKILFSELPDRIIGSLIISRLFVEFHFINYTEEQCQLFLKKFDLSFQRGGG